MEQKYLGKIVKAEFGTHRDRPFLMGLQLEFRFDNGGVSCGSRHLININNDCKWDSEEDKNTAYQRVLKELAFVLKEAKVNTVSELVGKPIEITIENQMYKSFCILTEVL
ncbi:MULTISPECIES: hypothetical protein [Bacillus cereus group]|uniref:hypothetical protein n=1 Tax=Bacillus cereus group TaxID=86661 RepID=UPI002E1B6B95|nr:MULTISPECIES: hypothetical protein [Bacillus cereus group]MED1436940.1 hypothetical protein [Bacillus mycoides]MED1473208.1 hypothetical protein [Bacillus pseudomycoides]